MLARFYYNLSIKYKILIFFYIIIIIIAFSLGLYSTKTSEKFVMSKVSSANLSVVKQINGDLDFLKQDIEDISTYLCIDDNVQALLQNTNDPTESIDSLKFIINVIAAKSYISCLILYGNQEAPVYYEFTDLSNGAGALSAISQSPVYKKAVALNGSTLWFSIPTRDNVFIQNNMFPKIGVCRTVKDCDDFEKIGFLLIGINEAVLQGLSAKVIQNEKEGILIIDENGNRISHSGANLLSPDFKKQKFYLDALSNQEGYTLDTINGQQYLVTYSQMRNDWRTFYAVPVYTLKKEINAVKYYTVLTVILCLLFSMPLMMLILSFLTAPINKLLKSMKRFQQGNFEESVEFKYKDEIGQLGEGYNKMVVNIKELINKAYVLQIKEREAELDALQAQINPHFLYNTLDTIFWKAQSRNQKEIGDMVYSLSKIFRLSLNRGKGSTPVAREKELLEHYLLLQKGRFKNKLEYELHIDEDIVHFVIPKLILQPFVENSILHALEGKENGGKVTVSGCLSGEKLHFIIEDNGIGMDETQLNNLNSSAISGGYAIRNVRERLEILYKDDFSLVFASAPGKGTRVDIIIPAGMNDAQEEEQE